MIRNALLYSPAAVCAIWAGMIAALGRSDWLVIGGAAVLAVALVFHTWQEIHDYSRGLM